MTHDRGPIRQLFAGQFKSELAATLHEAERTHARKFEFFGREFHYPHDINWQADPVTGARWPAVFHADVPVHGGDVGFGDVKHVWELNRQQYLVDLAKSFYLADRADHLASMQQLVLSWIAGNPYATGVNWSCALEPAFRAWSWLWSYHLTAPALDDDFHIEWMRSFYDHGRFLSRHLEHYSSPYNHLIGEAAALYAIGVCFPEFQDAAAWRTQGRHALEHRLGEQFYSDGGTVEQSTFYHHATTGFYLLAALLGRANGEEFSERVWTAIERAVEFSMRLVMPDGRTPEIGGADDGKPIRLEHLPFWDFRPFQAIGAVLFRHPGFKMVAGRFFEDALWLLGDDGRRAFDALDSAPPAETSVVLDASGYAVTRSGWSADADYVCMDIGEQAAGMRTDAIPNSMHGHADALSLIVALGGRRVLVDSGFFAYNCGGEWEAHFRETAAHNTARIDRRDQALHIGKMAWAHSYRVSILGHEHDRKEAWVAGSHDGYARGPEGLTHTRTVWRRPDGYVFVHDEFSGAGRHEIELNYQFAPGTLTLESQHLAVFDGFAEMFWAGRGAWKAEVCCGGPSASDGWICTSLGVRVAAPRLTLTTTMENSEDTVSLLTVLSKGRGRIRRVADGTTSGLSIVHSNGIDWIAARGAVAGDFVESDGTLAIVSASASGAVTSRAAMGRVTQVRGDVLGRLTARVMSAVGAR